MDSLERGMIMIVRLVAGALVLWSVMDFTLYFAVSYHNHKPVEVLPCVTQSIPLLIGIVLFIKTKAIARWVCDRLE